MLACFTSVGWAAVTWQRKYLPEWRGADRLLVQAIFGLSVVAAASYLTGLVRLFDIVWLSVLLLASGPIAWRLWKTEKPAGLEEKAPLPPAWLLAVLGGCLAVLLSAWFIPIDQAFHTGLAGTDALWYHLPASLRFFQTGSLLHVNYNEPLFQTYFYPLLGSVYHAVGMVFLERDFLSPLINLGFMFGALLAAASIGSRMKVAIPAVLGGAVIFGTNALMSGSAGSAMADTPAAFFFVAAVALMLRQPESRAALFAAGLAMGLGLGVKLTVAIPTAVFAVGILLLAGKGLRLKAIASFLGGIAITGGFWFLRNLINTGSPIPLLKIPLLPRPRTGEQMSTMHSLSEYFTDTRVMFDLLPDAWHGRLGPLWLPMVLGALLGPLVLAIKPPGGSKAWRLAGLVSLAALVGYFFTPGTAAGPVGGPIKGLVWDTRFIAPAIALGLALLPCALAQGLSQRWRDLMALPMGALLLVTTLSTRWWHIASDSSTAEFALPPSVHPSPRTVITGTNAAVLTGILLTAFGFAAFFAWRRLGHSARRGAIVVGLVGVLAGGWFVGTDYVAARAWGYSSQVPANGDLKIGIVGTAGVFNQYLMSGGRLQNHIVFIGVRGPHGSFRSVTGCSGIRRLVNRGNFDYVVVAPDRDIWKQKTLHNPLMDWLRNYPGLRFVRWLPGLPNNFSAVELNKADRFALYKVTGKLRSWSCAEDEFRAKLRANSR